ncbi:MAG: hypothetical protein U9P10_01715 [Thermodesulfobacteriota bacterium]|nr:hypothetical protein [Thermodesulfobacteriota bacterium]
MVNQKRSREVQRTAKEIFQFVSKDIVDQRRMANMAGLVVSLSVIVILLSVVVIRSVTGPLNKTITMLKDIAE